VTSVTITKDRLRQAIFDYIVQSRTGDNTLSYTTTAAMSADDVADSSADRLWDLLESSTTQMALYDDQPTMMLGEPPFVF
jgi:hypothetical protein